MPAVGATRSSARPRPALRRGPRRLAVPALDGRGPVWEQIRRALAAPIVRGEWPPGTHLPGEIALTEAFGVARMTVSRAIQSLANEGLVSRRRKLGTVVAERAQEYPVFEVWDTAERIARSGAEYGYQLLSCRELADDPERRALLGVPPRTPVFWMRALHLADGQPFQLEERLINVEAAPGVTCQPLEDQAPGRWLLANVPWTGVEHKVTAREATRTIAGELRVPTRTACLVVDHRVWNADTPVSYAQFWQSGTAHALVGHYVPKR
jgi:GntR family histidine utilization transcriptional repressor